MEDQKILEAIADCIDLETNRPLNEAVYDGLRKAVIIGAVPVGRRINQKNLSEFMHISRTPIRKSIEKLKDEGLLEEIPNFGVIVRRVTVEDAKEIFAIRVALDTLASTTAMEQMTEEDHAEMDELLKLTVLTNENNEIEKTIELFREFNDLIYHYARMPRLVIIQKQLREYLSRFRDISLYSSDRRNKAIYEHILIHHSIKTKNEELVGVIIKEHLDYSLSFIIDEINHYESEGAVGKTQAQSLNDSTGDKK